MTDDLAYLIDITREAGRSALRWFGQVEGTRKRDGTLVSCADTETERLLRRRIAERWPQDAVVGEELAGASDICEGRAWVIDPVDGTLNFLHGFAEWCISVGMTEDGRPVMGAIYAPVHDQIWYAEAGGGAFRDGTPIRASGDERLHTNQLFGVDSECIDLPALRIRPRKRNVGAAALHACYVAQGSFVGSLYAVWGLWDLAAGMAICLEAGARAWRLDGSPVEGLGEYCALQKSTWPLLLCAPALGPALVERLGHLQGDCRRPSR